MALLNYIQLKTYNYVAYIFALTIYIVFKKQKKPLQYYNHKHNNKNKSIAISFKHTINHSKPIQKIIR